MSDLPKNHGESEDLFDFPEVEGFSAEFIEAARQQTEAASATAPEKGPSFEDQGDDTIEVADSEYEDFEDDFTDLMGDSMDEAPEEEPVAVPAVAVPATSAGFDFRVVWGALTLLFAANILWAWTWHTSEDRLRGEMDQRFQGFLSQQRSQLDEAVSALTPSDSPEEKTQSPRPLLDRPAPDDSGASLIAEIEQDLVLSRYDTARAKAWRLIARIDAFPKERRDSVEASARLLIAESYEIQGTDSQEKKG